MLELDGRDGVDREHLIDILDSDVLRFFFSSRRRHTRCSRDWSSDVCSSDLRKNNTKGVADRSCHRRRGLREYQPIQISGRTDWLGLNTSIQTGWVLRFLRAS